MELPRLITSSSYDRIGDDRGKLARRHKSGDLFRVRRGIYVKTSDWNALSRRERHGLHSLAHTRVTTSEPVFCHATAALLWGLWIVGTPQKLHVATEVTSSGRNTKTVTRHIGSLTQNVVRCGPFLLSDKLSTTLQLIGSLSFPYAVAVCDSSLRPPDRRGSVNLFTPPGSDPFLHMPAWETDCPQGQPLTLDELRDHSERLPSAAARNRVLHVINFASDLSGSAGESLSRAKMHEMGFPAPVLQEKFRLDNGTDAFVDFWFKKQRIVGEFDGLGKYLRADWGGGLSLQERIIAEKKREDQIRAQGVTFVRWGWDEMKNREQLARILRRAGLPQTHTGRRAA